MSGLQPETQYYYRPGDATTALFSFVTPPSVG